MSKKNRVLKILRTSKVWRKISGQRKCQTLCNLFHPVRLFVWRVQRDEAFNAYVCIYIIENSIAIFKRVYYTRWACVSRAIATIEKQNEQFMICFDVILK